MLEAVKTEIDGKIYKFQPLMARRARAYLGKLQQALGPVWAQALDGLRGTKIDTSILDDGSSQIEEYLKLVPSLAGVISGTIRGIVEKIQPAFYEDLVDTFVGQVCLCTEDGREVELNTNNREIYFATSLYTEMRVLFWALQVQYADFFMLFTTMKTKAEVYIAQQQKKHKEPSKSQGESIGISSVSHPVNILRTP